MMIINDIKNKYDKLSYYSYFLRLNNKTENEIKNFIKIYDLVSENPEKANRIYDGLLEINLLFLIWLEKTDFESDYVKEDSPFYNTTEQDLENLEKLYHIDDDDLKQMAKRVGIRIY
jgi:hypothetical protein